MGGCDSEMRPPVQGHKLGTPAARALGLGLASPGKDGEETVVQVCSCRASSENPGGGGEASLLGCRVEAFTPG